jgi:hypothetical protein
MLESAFPIPAATPEPGWLIDEIAAGLKEGALIPYIGPGVYAACDVKSEAPTTPEAVAAALHLRAPAPGRIRTNMWSVAQFIEQRRHRKTLTSFMADIFAKPAEPTPLHRALAKLTALPLIIDVWYDSAMRDALAGRNDWREIQGVSRALEFTDIWHKTYDCAGEEISGAVAAGDGTLLYKPHGGVTPAKNFLVADSDYVEVLTEIDIQTPIPHVVKALRATRGFVFIGCPFHDQMLRTYARQIAKRSAGPNYIFVGAGKLTRNEQKFLQEMNMVVVKAPLAQLVAKLD